jgi:MFS family permease
VNAFKETAETSIPKASNPRNAMVASVAGYAIDGFDLLILSFLLPAISASFSLTSTQAASLVTATLVGAVVGGITFGVLSDSFGRVRVLSWTIIVFAVATGLCGLSRGFDDMIIWRAIAGLGLGGEFGIGMTLVAEVWPARKRARAASYVGLGWQAGALAAALLTPLLLPMIGWRGMFVFGMIPGLFSFVLRRMTPEPEIFMNRMPNASPRMSLRLLIADSQAMRRSFAMFLLCSIQNFGYFGLMIWLPSYLSSVMGYSLTKSSLWTAATIIGMCAGILSFGEIADRLGRRPAFIIFQAGSAAMVFAYPHFSSPTSLLVGGAAMGFFANGMIGGYGALMAELFPTEARATAQNVLFNMGRAVGGFGPLIVGAVAAAHSLGYAIALLSSIYVVDIIVTVLLIPETKGKALS